MPVDTHTGRFAPQIGHWDEWTVIYADGSLSATYHLSGYLGELAGVSAMLALKNIENDAARNISDPRIEVWDHFHRQDNQAMSALPQAGNWFADRFDRGYRRAQGNDLCRNDLFITILLRREDSLRGGLQALAGGGKSDHPQADRAMEDDLRDILHRLEPSLRRHGMRRLGVRDGRFSEIFEAFHLIANGFFRPIGLSEGRMGRLIVPDRIVFEDRKPGEYRIMAEHGAILGAIVSIMDYPSFPRGTAPDLLDVLRSAPFSITITNAYLFRQKWSALKFLRTKRRNMQSSGDEAEDQTAELRSESKSVAGGKSVYGKHAFSVDIRAATYQQLDANVARVSGWLSDAGMVVTRETDALKPAFYAKIPGNWMWHPRPANMQSVNWVSLAAKHNAPRGRDRGRWGAPIVMLRTTMDTEYGFHFQVQGSAQMSKEDLGNCMFFGPSGSGKTSLLGTVCLLALRIPTARVVILDKGFGLAPMAKAAGGAHLEMRDGWPCIAPLKALDNTPEDIAHLTQIGLGMILTDEQGPLSNNDHGRLERGIKRQMQLPRELRSWWGVAAMLTKRKEGNRESACDRLRPWCRGQRLGWALDGDRDLLDMGRRLVCVETGELLKNAVVRGPTLAHLSYRTRKLVNGQPLVFAVDEGWVVDTVEQVRDDFQSNLKEIRKNEGVCLLSTQSPGLALKSKIADDYRQQVPTKIFFADSSASYDDLVNKMGLTEAEFHFITAKLPNMPYTFLVKRPSGSVVCSLNLSRAPDLVSVISGRRSTYELMLDLIAQHGDEPQQWVPHFEQQAPLVVDEPTLDMRPTPALTFAEAAE